MPGDGSSYGFVVRHMEVDYLAVSVLGDLLSVKSKIISIKNTSMQLLQEIYKEDIKLFSMKLTLVYVESCISKNIPNHFRNLFQNIQEEKLKNIFS